MLFIHTKKAARMNTQRGRGRPRSGFWFFFFFLWEGSNVASESGLCGKVWWASNSSSAWALLPDAQYFCFYWAVMLANPPSALGPGGKTDSCRGLKSSGGNGSHPSPVPELSLCITITFTLLVQRHYHLHPACLASEFDTFTPETFVPGSHLSRHGSSCKYQLNFLLYVISVGVINFGISQGHHLTINFAVEELIHCFTMKKP